MTDIHHRLINTLLAIEWLLLVAVMFGGESLLRLSHESMSEHTERYFRVGHAHAGVLAGMGIMLVLVLPRTGLASQGMVLTWLGWLAGVALLSGGFFLHAYTGETGQASAGTWMTAVGGVVLMSVAVWLAVQLLRAR